MKNRKPNRWREFDYGNAGYYFLTICTKNRETFFGRVENNQIQLSDIGEIAKHCWDAIPVHFNTVELDEFVIMPNHIHGILIVKNVLVDAVGDNAVGDNDPCPPRNMELIPKTMSQYKSSVTREIRKQLNNFKFAWQRSYHDRVIRDEKELFNVRRYIINNPAKWNKDNIRIQSETIFVDTGDIFGDSDFFKNRDIGEDNLSPNIEGINT